MAGRSILYLGDSDFAAGFCNKLEAYACCGALRRQTELSVPDLSAGDIDLVMFEPPAKSDIPGFSLASFVRTLNGSPLIAVTRRHTEHRGIAAVKAGAQGYICADEAGHIEIEATIDHAIQRHRLLARLSETDSVCPGGISSPATRW